MTHVAIEALDLLGRKFEMLVNKKHQADYHQAIWNADGFSSGVYFYKLHAGDFTGTKKMLLIK